MDEPSPFLIARDELTPLVRRRLGSDDAEISTWTVESTRWMNVMSGRLARASGTAIGGGWSAPLAWSLILKVYPAPRHAASSQPGSWDYWRREVDAYTGQSLIDLPGGITTPDCYGTIERSDGTIVLALEEIEATVTEKWSFDDYARHMHSMGKFGAAFLAQRPMPREPSLGRGGLRSWVEGLRDAIAEEPTEIWSAPLASRVVGDATDLDGLIASSASLLDALERLPHTFAHRDVTPGNMLVRAGRPPVLIDWALAGVGPIGEESACSVGASLWQLYVEPQEADALDAAVLTAYRRGMNEAGSNIESGLLSFGHAAALALRFGLLVPFWAARLATTDDPSWFERRFGQSVPAVADAWNALFGLALRRWREAAATADA